MAAVFDLQDREASRSGLGDEVGEAFGLIAEHLLDLPARSALRKIEGFRGVLDATESLVLANLIGDDGDTRRAESAASCTGRTSKKTRKRRANRAKAVKANGALADKMAAGHMTDEQVDVIAAAAAKTDGAAALDENLIDEVAGTDPDQGAKVADQYVTDHTDAGATQRRYDRQRRQRSARRFVTDTGLDAVILKGDAETIAAIWGIATSTSRAFYVADGGRDIAGALHPRTGDQRMFDAFVSHITGKAKAHGPNNQAGRGSAQTGQPAATGDSGRSNTQSAHDPGTRSRRNDHSRTSAASATMQSGQRDGTGSAPISSKRFTPAKARPVIVVGVSLAKFMGSAPDEAAELIGVGPIADSVLAEYIESDADIIGALFGQRGQPLWLSRRSRFANRAQLLALIIRDKSCVLCGRAHQHCDAHHLTPWNAPAKGETDINNLALVCGDCHRRLHDNNQTLYRTHNGRWKLRPATPAETPPPRPSKGQAPQRE